jgi:hypothetical protein
MTRGRALAGTLVSMHPPVQEAAGVRWQLDALRASTTDARDAVIDTGLSYLPGHPVRVHVRKRGNRYDITDAAAAVHLAARPAGWFATASDTVAQIGLNINRRGVVFVTGFERRDLVDLAMRLADCSRFVYLSLLEAGDELQRT